MTADSPAVTLDRRLSIAPMMGCTDRHARYFLRLFSPHLLLYTEMVTSAALRHGDRSRLLDYDLGEHPLALQLGGSDPNELAAAAQLGVQWGYDEINLNLGCPSDRVQAGRFGACLMKEPALVEVCLGAMVSAVNIPVTAKIRIGVDEIDSFEELCRFVEAINRAGVSSIIVHARKAWLKGLSPKENREIPPLDYQRVHQLKQQFPQLEIILNGGLKNLDQVTEQLAFIDGCMIGREAYHNPAILLGAEQQIYQQPGESPSRRDILERFYPYIDRQLALGVPLHSMTRHLLGLFQGEPGARRFRRHLSEQGHKRRDDARLLHEAVALLAAA